jgi:hypothetical protein
MTGAIETDFRAPGVGFYFFPELPVIQQDKFPGFQPHRAGRQPGRLHDHGKIFVTDLFINIIALAGIAIVKYIQNQGPRFFFFHFRPPVCLLLIIYSL